MTVVLSLRIEKNQQNTIIFLNNNVKEKPVYLSYAVPLYKYTYVIIYTRNKEVNVY